MKKLLLLTVFASAVFADPGLIRLAKGTIDPEAPKVSAAGCRSASRNTTATGEKLGFRMVLVQ